MKVLFRTAIREAERRALEDLIPEESLMEEAGKALSEETERFTGNKSHLRALVMCGHGNNGGDGFVCARHLASRGAQVTVLLAEGDPATDDARAMYALLPSSVRIVSLSDEIDSLISSIDVVIDCVYGIGFHGQLNDTLGTLFNKVNSAPVARVSADIPSGVECDTGRASANCFRADLTVTFSALKGAHILFPASDMCGCVVVRDVGIPERIIADAESVCETIERADVRALFAPRVASSHKGTYGTLLCICGSYGMAGGAILSARSAIRCGAGLVRVLCTPAIYPILAAAVPEAVFKVLPEGESGTISREALPLILSELRSSTACLAGCAMGWNTDTESIVGALVNQTAPLVLDADALNSISARPDILRGARCPVIITPHPGEMARLTGRASREIQENRLSCAEDFASGYGVTVVLKGANTLVSSPDAATTRVNRTGNPGMARGGSGDVLTGMIASFLAQRMAPFDAACAGVYIHGLAGDIAARENTQYAMAAGDIIESLPAAFKALTD